MVAGDEVGWRVQVCKRAQLLFGDVSGIDEIAGYEYVIRGEAVYPVDHPGEKPTTS